MDARPIKLTLKIHNMHCVNCEVVVERKFKAIPGVKSVRVRWVMGRADIVVAGTEPALAEFADALKGEDYLVSPWSEGAASPNGRSKTNTRRDYAEIGAVFLLVMGAFLLLKQFDLLPKSFTITTDVSFGFAFLIGLAAAFSSCLAVTGGLLLAVAAKYSERHPELDDLQRFKPTLYFNIGRVVSYTVLGATVGALGSTLTLSERGTGVLSLLASVIMIILGLQLLNLFPWTRRLHLTLPKALSHRIHDLSGSAGSKPYMPFALGALTFFLPCGFTQALQLYVLSTGSPVAGAITMLAFALGTLPTLLSLSAISSFARGSFQKHFLRFAGVIVAMLGLWNVNNGLALAGLNLRGSSSNAVTASSSDSSAARVPIIDGIQTANMMVIGLDYFPSRFTVRAGVPVNWKIDAKGAVGCAQVLIAPALGVRKFLSADGVTTIIFTPSQPGLYPFSCAMGMTTASAAFKVVP